MPADIEPGELFLDHVSAPYHRGSLARATHRWQERNPLCGDEVLLQVVIDGHRIREAWFEGRGCLLSQGAASLLCEFIENRTVPELRGMTPEEALALLGFPLTTGRRNCGLLSYHALQRLLLQESSDSNSTSLSAPHSPDPAAEAPSEPTTENPPPGVTDR